MRHDDSLNTVLFLITFAGAFAVIIAAARFAIAMGWLPPVVPN